MRLDDSKYKVYIYNMDDEISSSDNESDAADEGKLIFLPDIQKHLKANRIPPQILANSDGELAGMQLVLYRDPKSLSVPESKDGVRKAIIESRNRMREKHPGADTTVKTSANTTPFGSSLNAPTDSLAVAEPLDVEMDMD